MLLNLTNHPSTEWSDTQRNVAQKKYSNIKDLPFPKVPPEATSEEIKLIAADTVKDIYHIAGDGMNEPFAVHIMGEMTLVYRIVKLLQQAKIKCLASTTNRITIDNQDGSKNVKFKFIEFREYV